MRDPLQQTCQLLLKGFKGCSLVDMWWDAVAEGRYHYCKGVVLYNLKSFFPVVEVAKTCNPYQAWPSSNSSISVTYDGQHNSWRLRTIDFDAY